MPAASSIAPLERARISAQRAILQQIQQLAKRVSRGKPLPQHLLTGKRGEFEALFFLRRHGYQVVERRWRTSEANGDLDLIAWDGGTLCFIEVKTRTARDNTPARSAVGYSKENMLRKMARLYRRTLPEAQRLTVLYRFDVVSVYLLDDAVECELLRHAFDNHEPRSRSAGV